MVLLVARSVPAPRVEARNVQVLSAAVPLPQSTASAESRERPVSSVPLAELASAFQPKTPAE